MSITAKKITTTTVLAGGSPEKFLPVKSYDHNLVVDDLTSLDARVTDLEDGDVTFVDLTLTGDLDVQGATTVVGLVATGNVTALGLISDTISESTAGAGVRVDGALIKDGGLSNVAGLMFAGFFPTIAAQALSGAGAVNVTAYLTKFTSTGAGDALTIASGTQIGQRKKVSHVVDGGSGVLTGVFVGGTTITFTSVGEFADLIWTGQSWGVLELGNTATPGTPPALA